MNLQLFPKAQYNGKPLGKHGNPWGNNGFLAKFLVRYLLGHSIIKIIGKRWKTNTKRKYPYHPLGEDILGKFEYHIERLGIFCSMFCYHEVERVGKEGNAKPDTYRTCHTYSTN